MINTFKYKKYKFEAGDVIEDLTPQAERRSIEVPLKFVAPRRIDYRDMCLNSNNQHKTPHCAGYSTAGYIEFNNWKTIHYPAQVDGDAIYLEAKKIEGNTARGTTLKNAVQGAIKLGLIDGNPKYVGYPSVREASLSKAQQQIISIKFAIHEHGVVIAGFRITNEWDYVDRKNGMIRNMGSKAKARGGHAVLLCGYDNKGVYIQNSWGPKWGHYGFAILSWEQYIKQIMQAMVVEKN